MWFFDSIELLPRPSLKGVAPHFALLGTFLAFEPLSVSVAGLPVSALGLAVFAYLALTLGRNMTRVLDTLRAGAMPNSALIPVVLILPLIVAGVFAADPLIVQRVWLFGWIVYTMIFVGIVSFGEDGDLDLLPSRWASSDEPLSRPVLMIHGLRFAAEAAAASWLMLHAPLLDWVIFASLGRLAGYYLAEWLIVLFILARDPD